MSKEDIYNSLAQSKKTSSKQIKLYIIGSVSIVAMVLIFAFSVVMGTFNKLIVIDSKANIVPGELTTKDVVLETTLTKFCSDVAYYGNTFDRVTLKKNQALTKFIMEEKSAIRMWSFYKKENHYYDAVQRGFSYSGKFLKMLEMDTTKKPYKVKFLGEVEIYEGAKITRKLKYIAQGYVTDRSAKFPENYFGWYITDYLQNFKGNE